VAPAAAPVVAEPRVEAAPSGRPTPEAEAAAARDTLRAIVARVADHGRAADPEIRY
jgi:hypothetical protein